MEPWSLEETRQRVRGSMRDTYPDLFGSRWLEAGEVFYQRFSERHLDELKPLQGAEELLRQLKGQGLYLAVVSNKKGDYLRAEVTRLGWDSVFGRIVGAFDAPRDKPWPDPIHMALDGSGIEPGAGVWFVGDADIDVECAINSGCTPVLMREEPPRRGEFAKHAPALHVEGCITLCRVLRNL
jgi:phosphoglycolate phosphatase